MIPFTLLHRPNVLKVSILLQLFFNSPSSLQINLNRSTISLPHTINRNSNSPPSPLMPARPQKTLRRLPHVFSQVLELPFLSNADVFIEDRSDCFRFTANVEVNAFAGGQVRAHAVKIYPGITKVVVREGNGDGEVVELLLDKLEVDAWRFRLPTTARPELATAVVMEAKLVVTVPKGRRSCHGGKVEDGRPEVWGGGRGQDVIVR